MQKWTDSPWERQRGESEKAFAAFVIYRDLGEKRTITEVARKLTRSRQWINEWKDKWRWKERAAEYDQEMQRVARKAARETMAEEYETMIKRQIAISLQLQSKAMKALQTLKPEKLTPKEIREWLKMSTELERMNRALVEEKNEKQSTERNSIVDDPISEALKGEFDHGQNQ